MESTNQRQLLRVHPVTFVLLVLLFIQHQLVVQHALPLHTRHKTTNLLLPAPHGQHVRRVNIQQHHQPRPLIVSAVTVLLVSTKRRQLLRVPPVTFVPLVLLFIQHQLVVQHALPLHTKHKTTNLLLHAQIGESVVLVKREHHQHLPLIECVVAVQLRDIKTKTITKAQHAQSGQSVVPVKREHHQHRPSTEYVVAAQHQNIKTKTITKVRHAQIGHSAYPVNTDPRLRRLSTEYVPIVK
jgi:hypothetical protein